MVFICGVEEGLIPHEDADLEEERRLLFVGLTRANGRGGDALRAEQDSVSANGFRPEPSRFLEEYSNVELLKRERLTAQRRVRQADQLRLF